MSSREPLEHAGPGLLAASGAAAAAAALFAASLVVIRAIVPTIGPAKLAAVRFLLGSVFLWALAAYRGKARLPERRLWRRLAAMGFLYFTCFPMFFNWGLVHTTAARGAVMIASAPVWSAIIARAAGRERLSRIQVVGTLLTVVGVTVCSFGRTAEASASSPLLGDALVLAAAACGAGYAVIGLPVVREIGAFPATLFSMVIGTVLLLPFAVAEIGSTGFAVPPTSALLWLAFVATLGGGLPFLLWTAALSRLSPTAVSVYGNLIPVFAAALGWIALSEPLGLHHLAALALVLVGVWLVSGRRTA